MQPVSQNSIERAKQVSKDYRLAMPLAKPFSSILMWSYTVSRESRRNG